jgi:hypothetical protein
VYVWNLKQLSVHAKACDGHPYHIAVEASVKEFFKEDFNSGFVIDRELFGGTGTSNPFLWLLVLVFVVVSVFDMVFFGPVFFRFGVFHVHFFWLCDESEVNENWQTFQDFHLTSIPKLKIGPISSIFTFEFSPLARQ